MRGCEILNRKADRARPCQRLCRPALTTDARSYEVEREGGGAGLKLAPPGRLEFQREAEYVAVERDRAAHVRHVDLDVIDFAKHHAPLCDARANWRTLNRCRVPPSTGRASSAFTISGRCA